MESMLTAGTNVVRFPGPRVLASPRYDQRSLLEAVYAAGSLPIAAEDRTTKAMATRLTICGFVVVDEVQADGTARRLRASEAIYGSTERPWRVSKPSSRYALHDLPATDEDMFAALPA
ncbi:MAG TPA: hypothetical protein VIL09_14330 [Microvirga sp.]|jgi:hypothetical protein